MVFAIPIRVRSRGAVEVGMPADSNKTAVCCLSGTIPDLF
jgi:hypothetical protein